MPSRFISFLIGLPPNTIFAMRINSESMLPMLKIGDRIIVEKTPIESVKVGDVIVFSNVQLHSELPVAHRVIKKVINPSIALKTKGDNSTVAEQQLVTRTNYIGRMIRKEPFLKTKLFNLLQKLSF